ncbi:MAG TPA: hypothetical protein VNC50_06995 [Planctomycetia bacterium]|nr:hypothetical protein [Planctomycetia bacterium]
MAEWRFGPGPVFTADLVRQGRRWQTYATRSLVLLGILLAMVVGQAMRSARPGATASPVGFRSLAVVGAQLFEIFAVAELTLVLFVAPAMSASVLIPERNRGTLFHILMTDLSSTEIVLAKYAGRVVPILALIAAAFPLTALLVLLGGIDPGRVLALGLLLCGCALIVPAAFLLLSLFLKRVADLLALAYTVLSIWCVLPMMSIWRVRIPGVVGDWINDHSPFMLVRYVAGFGAAGSFEHVLEFFALAAILAAACVAITAWRMRPMTLAEADRGAEAKPRRWMRPIVKRGREPDLDSHPILWLEWARNRRGLSLLLYRLVLFGGSGLAAFLLISELFATGMGARVPAVFTLAFTLPIVHLLALVGVAGQLAEDRQNRHFEMLGVTNLDPAEILRDRSAATAKLGETAMKVATIFVAIAIAIQPLRAMLGAAMMAATAYGLGRLVLSLAQWIALRFAKPWVGLSLGVAALAFLNIGVFLIGIALGPGSNNLDGVSAWTLAILLAIAVFFWGWNRNPAAKREGRWRTSTRAWRGVLGLTAFVVGLLCLAGAGRSLAAIAVIQTSPFGGFVCNGATAVDSRFLGSEFGAANVLFTFFLAAFWVHLAGRLDRSSPAWLEARMRERDSRSSPSARLAAGRLPRLAAKLRIDAAT